MDSLPRGCGGGRGYSNIWAIEVCATPNGVVFLAVLCEIGYQLDSWIGYVFLEEGTSSSLGDKTYQQKPFSNY